jgi:putative ABC transport system permease protein
MRIVLYWRRFRHQARALFYRDRVEKELDRELQLHLDQLVRERVAEGVSERDARLAAERAFGSPALVAERCRDTRGVGVIED